MRLSHKKFRWTLLYAVFLIAFTLYVLLDTFVITRVYTVVSKESEDTKNQDEESTVSSNESQTNESQTAETNTSSSLETAITESSYSDENITITIQEYREHDTTIYAADVIVSSSEYLQTAFAKQSYGRNVTEKTSEIASEVNAILAINGDYYGSQTEGYVIRNGVLYREKTADSQEDLVIWNDGSFEIITEGEISASELLESGADNVLSFGPALVTGSAVSVSESEEVGKAKASNPRTAIGIIDDLHYVFIVSDGRTTESEGLSLYQLAVFMQSLGVQTAYNLDGGGSSTMYFNGSVVNNPTSSGNSIKERSVSDIVYIGY